MRGRTDYEVAVQDHDRKTLLGKGAMMGRTRSYTWYCDNKHIQAHTPGCVHVQVPKARLKHADVWNVKYKCLESSSNILGAVHTADPTSLWYLIGPIVFFNGMQNTSR
jgi:hypothetical protein